MTNTPIHLTAAPLALLEVLFGALMEANRLDGKMAYQSHAFGKIADALVESTACAIADSQVIFFEDARDIGKAIYSACLDSGEGPTSMIAAWNEGRFDKNFRI